MTKQEFESRVRIEVTQKEYEHIEYIYIQSDVDKDEFCRLWSMMNSQRISRYQDSLWEQAKLEAKKDRAFAIFERLRPLSMNGDTMFEIAENFLKDEEVSFLSSIGIEMQGRNSNGVPYFRSICDIAFETGQFAGVYSK